MLKIDERAAAKQEIILPWPYQHLNHTTFIANACVFTNCRIIN